MKYYVRQSNAVQPLYMFTSGQWSAQARGRSHRDTDCDMQVHPGTCVSVHTRVTATHGVQTHRTQAEASAAA